MKIVILGTAWPYRGGLAIYNERLAREFSAENDNVTIHTFSLQYPSFLFPGKTQYSSEPEPTDLNIIRSLNSVNPFNWIKTGRTIREMKPDILIIKFWLPFMAPALGKVARIVRRNGKTRVVSILDNIIPHERRPGDRLLSRYFTRSVDGFVAMSESVLEDLGQFDTAKPRVFCPHPLYDNFGPKATREESLSFLGLDPSKRYMLFFGLIRDYKGLDLILRAYADSRFRKMEVRLIVAGEFYSGSEKYFELEKELGLEGLVVWKSDFVPDSEVKYCFGAADIIVQPYKSATQSGVTQIAYHFEKPMLVTDVGGLAEIVPHGSVGYVVKPDMDEIADALTDFFKNNRQEEFTEGILKEKKKYSWSNMTRSVRKAAE
ncbi:MAG: D-inositol 3-phosphate glycosyltransferase [Bacteroidetes bacterium ADurb.BinA104]|jgi:glycosyltransferase involved in cell wall biosynthesis|nr:MAG: D-inositol 3-phosphate glycosyltransferase [Bacteroidetes bacterium ADurb.BinA104]